MRRAEYDAVYREAKRRTSRQFTLFLRPNGLPISRFGWSIKKALGNAVQRNRIRRRLREIVRLHRQEIAGGWDVVIHPRSTVGTAEFLPLASELVKLIPRDVPTPMAAKDSVAMAAKKAETWDDAKSEREGT